MKEEQLQQIRENMMHDILEVIEGYKSEVGCGMMTSDIVGILEWVKMEIFLESNGDMLLRHTSISLE